MEIARPFSPALGGDKVNEEHEKILGSFIDTNNIHLILFIEDFGKVVTRYFPLNLSFTGVKGITFLLKTRKYIPPKLDPINF